MKLVGDKGGDKGGNEDTLPSGAATSYGSSFTGIDIVNDIKPINEWSCGQGGRQLRVGSLNSYCSVWQLKYVQIRKNG